MNIPANPASAHKVAVRLYDAPSAQGHGNFKILLIKLDHIGDFITAINAFRQMRRAFTGAEITLICLPSIVDIAQSTGLFDRVVGFAAEQVSPALGKVPRIDPEDLLARFTDLLEEPYFLAADFKHDVFDPTVWLDHVDAQYRAGFARATQKGLDILLPTMEWKTPFTALGGKNQAIHAETRLTLLAHAIIETLLESPLDADMFSLSEDQADNPSYRALKTTDRLKIGLSVAAGAELRRWPVNYWKSLTQRLTQDQNALLVFFGGRAEQEETREIISGIPAASVLDLTGSLPLAHLPAHLNLLDGYIGCDTGLTHLAARLDVPTLNIYAGISNISVWRARGPRVKTVYAETICAPCHLRLKKDCPNKHICMEAILPEIVYDCFGQLMTPV